MRRIDWHVKYCLKSDDKIKHQTCEQFSSKVPYWRRLRRRLAANGAGAAKGAGADNRVSLTKRTRGETQTTTREEGERLQSTSGAQYLYRANVFMDSEHQHSGRQRR